MPDRVPDYNDASPCACGVSKAAPDGYCFTCRRAAMEDDWECTKKRFKNKRNAQIALTRILITAMKPQYTHKQECRIYFCDDCNAYHLTSSPLRGSHDI